MTARDSNLFNAFETNLSANMGALDLTATVASSTGMTSPCYLVIDPDDDAKREYVYFDGTFTGTTFVTSNVANRFLAGSAAGSGLTHSSGAVVRCAPVAQHFEDLHDRIDGKVSLLDGALLDTIAGFQWPAGRGTPGACYRIGYSFAGTVDAVSGLGVVMDRPGSLRGIRVRCDTARTGGTASFQVYKNGAALVNITATINNVDTTSDYATQAHGVDTFVAGDVLTVRCISTSLTGPTYIEAAITVGYD